MLVILSGISGHLRHCLRAPPLLQAAPSVPPLMVLRAHLTKVLKWASERGERLTSTFHRDRIWESTKSSALSTFWVDVVYRFGSLRNNRSRSSLQSPHWRKVLRDVSLTISLILTPSPRERRRLRRRPCREVSWSLEEEPGLLPSESLGSELLGSGPLESASLRSW